MTLHRDHSPERAPAELTSPTPFRFSRQQSLVLVFLCTLFGVAAQFLIKTSTQHGAISNLHTLLQNYWLLSGLALYGISTVLLTLALRDAELSLLYPVISLTYVWVTILSVLVFHEALTPFKVLGVAVICAGVAMLGKKRQ